MNQTYSGVILVHGLLLTRLCECQAKNNNELNNTMQLETLYILYNYEHYAFTYVLPGNLDSISIHLLNSVQKSSLHQKTEIVRKSVQ